MFIFSKFILPLFHLSANNQVVIRIFGILFGYISLCTHRPHWSAYRSTFTTLSITVNNTRKDTQLLWVTSIIDLYHIFYFSNLKFWKSNNLGNKLFSQHSYIIYFSFISIKFIFNQFTLEFMIAQYWSFWGKKKHRFQKLFK